MIKQVQDRAYQTTDRQNIEKAWEESNRVLYQLPTGGGKSVVMKGTMKDYQEEDQIVFAHKRKLISQLEDHLKSVGITPGILQGTRKENLSAKIVIASIRTAVKDKNLEMLLQRKWKRAYIDEARHSRTGSYDKVLQSITESLPDIKILGVDATPYRKDKKRLDKWFQVMVTSCEDVKSLQAQGYLAKMRTYATPIKDIKEDVQEVAGDYQKEQLSKFMRKPKYLNYVVNNYIKRGEDRQALCFAVDIAHSKELLATFSANGVSNVRMVSSEDSEDEIAKIFEAYEKGKIQVLINVEMVTEGVDLPETKCIIGARPTKSLTLYLQMAGRGTRPKEDGGDCILLDCCGWTNGPDGESGFGSIDSPKHWTLNPEIDPNNPRKKNRIVGKKADGTFTDEPEEFDELVEMTPEEYMRNLSGGLERAQKHNLTIEEQVEEVQLRINDLLSKIPDAKHRSDFDNTSAIDERSYVMHCSWFLRKLRKGKRLTAKDDILKDESDKPIDWRSPYVTLTIGHGRPYYTILKSYSDDFDKQSEGCNNYVRTSMLAGHINEQFGDSKGTIKKLMEMYDEILDLKKAKIDIKEIQQAAEKFKEEEWQKKVNSTIKEEEWLEFRQELEESDFFKSDRYYNTKILAIKVLGNQVNAHHNKLMIRVRERSWGGNKPDVKENEKNYVKGEKVWELLKAGRYQPKETK